MSIARRSRRTEVNIWPAFVDALGQDDILRNHLRNIEGYLARLSEEAAEGRVQTVQDLRSEIRLLARTIAALADENR